MRENPAAIIAGGGPEQIWGPVVIKPCDKLLVHASDTARLGLAAEGQDQ
jgi:hypothetical protein